MLMTETGRLSIRRFELGDAEYILRQLNESSFKRNISDKQVRDIADAEKYLLDVPLASYEKHGFGLYLVVLKDQQIPIGMCGLVKRDELDYPDLGYAFLPDFWGQGYAFEASQAVLSNAVRIHRLDNILGLVLPHNHGSERLLVKLGFAFDSTIEIAGNTNNLYLYRSRDRAPY